MEFTGTDIDNRPDCYEESATERLEKLCQVAESHVPIQIGITLVKHENNCFQCSTYNFYTFPWVGPELLGHDPSFSCRAAALQFNADKNHIDFNKWLKNAVPYMSSEDEARYLASPLSQGDADLPRKVGMLRVWKLLCEARVPLVTHCPLDIFFLLACFERRNLPRDPAEMAGLILKCLPCVFDTAHLHGCIGGFKTLRLVKFLEDARVRHAELASAGEALPCCFDLVPETAVQYGNGSDFAHEAGFDSLCTAQLYAYLFNLSPEKVGQSANRLFLYKSIECLDLRRAVDFGEPGTSIFELTHESFLVARLSGQSDARALKMISSAGFVYKRMDSSHVLVTLGTLGSEATSKASELDAIPGVQWNSFEHWRAEARSDPSDVDATVDYHNLAFDTSKLSFPITANPASYEPEPAPCSKVEAWLDSEVEPRYRGFIKTFHASNGYGFISCTETFARFKRDVFVHRGHSQIVDLQIGQEVTFAVHTNARGQPQAKELRGTDALSWLGGMVDPIEEDLDERTTTIGASSDCASASDLDSIRDGSFSLHGTSTSTAHTRTETSQLAGAVFMHDLEDQLSKRSLCA